MADPEHIAIAKAGSNAISRWREQTFWVPNENPIVYSLNYSLGDRSTGETFEQEYIHGRAKLDLSGGYLSGIRLPQADLAHDDLSRADLTGCNLRLARLAGANLQAASISRANLSHADLTFANLTGSSLIRTDLSNSTLHYTQASGANLSYSDLRMANLEGANLAGANLSYTDLSWANLNGANLRGASLTATTLMLADLTGADLRGATITGAELESAVLMDTLLGFTRLVNCDLSKTIGLETSRHSGPSSISLDTLASSRGMIPAVFLQNAGVAHPLLAAQDVMRSENRTYPTTLIVGSLEDEELAGRLRSGLAAFQVPAWAIAADDEAAIQSGGILMEHTPYYDALVLLGTEPALDSPQTSTYLAQLAGARSGSQSSQTIVILGIDHAFYQRDDYLCNTLRQGQVLDFRGWDDPDAGGEAITSLASLLTERRL
ncbi:MAG: pentapeptide repeat-containing protein [Chloroflexota bacterium]|nr:pentapeptide repeat-containing protein [Chloroflexota bacterium]